jgi:hypothetical protein
VPLGKDKDLKETEQNPIIEAVEFKVKRELQISNMNKYHDIAVNTQKIQNAHYQLQSQWCRDLSIHTM